MDYNILFEGWDKILSSGREKNYLEEFLSHLRSNFKDRKFYIGTEIMVEKMFSLNKEDKIKDLDSWTPDFWELTDKGWVLKY